MGKGNVGREVSGAGPRLFEELKERGISVRDFHARIKKSGVRGSAYSSVWSYLQGRVEPAAEFLREAATILDLREAYLSRGDLPKTRQEERTEALREREKRLKERGPGALIVDEGLESVDWGVGPRALFHDTWRRYVAGAKGDLSDTVLLQMGALLMTFVDLPRKVWGFSHDLSGQQADDFRVAMLHALMLALPTAGEGDHLKERDVRWPRSWKIRDLADQAEDRTREEEN